jgi:hypothetical protein
MEFNIDNTNNLIVRNFTSTEYVEKYITFKQFLLHVYEDFCYEDRLLFNQACADLLKNTLAKENDVIKKKGFDDIEKFLYNFINEKDPKNVKLRLKRKIADKNSISLIEFYRQIYCSKKKKKKKKKKVVCSLS